MRLLCFAGAGSSAAIYRRWTQFLPRSIEVCPIELPGHGSRWNEPLLESFDSAVDSILPSVVPLLGPEVALFGHSLGAFICFELARRMHVGGLSAPAHLFIAAARAPQTPRREGPLAELPDEQFLAHILRLDGTPQRVLEDVSAMDLYLPILRADARLFDTFVCRETIPLPVPMSVFGGDKDPEVRIDDLSGWRAHTSKDFQVNVFRGGHFFFRSGEAQFVSILESRLGSRTENGLTARH